MQRIVRVLAMLDGFKGINGQQTTGEDKKIEKGPEKD